MPPKMPFEPLRTDEKLDHKPNVGPDMDTQMLMGCMGFVTTSLITYFLAVWPHFFLTDGYLLRTLVIALAVGSIPAAVAGVYACRRFGLSGACGYLGGTMAFCVFIHLRVQQFLMASGSRDLPQPEYPDNFAWWIPIMVVLFGFLVAALALPKSERPDSE